MDWNLRIESRLTRIETSLEELRQDVQQLCQTLERVSMDVAGFQGTSDWSRRAEARIVRLETEMLPSLERRLERVYTVGSVIAFLIMAAATLLSL